MDHDPPPGKPMNNENINPADAKLGAWLHEARVAPALPPRFQEGVWRRIEKAEAPARAAGDPTWLDALVVLLLRPRWAVPAAAVLIAAGALLGAREGGQLARHDAQAHYLAAVAPHSLR